MKGNSLNSRAKGPHSTMRAGSKAITRLMCDTVTLKTNIPACVLIEEKRRTTSGFSDDATFWSSPRAHLSYTAQRRTEFWMDYDARLYWCFIIVTHLHNACYL